MIRTQTIGQANKGCGFEQEPELSARSLGMIPGDFFATPQLAMRIQDKLSEGCEMSPFMVLIG